MYDIRFIRTNTAISSFSNEKEDGLYLIKYFYQRASFQSKSIEDNLDSEATRQANLPLIRT
jgi:hypothetical protein